MKLAPAQLSSASTSIHSLNQIEIIMRAIVVAIHGILTRQTDASWPDRLDAWLFARDPEVRVLKKEYGAGPWPIWNCLVKDRLLAEGLAAELELLIKSTGTDSPPVWVVAHSNGAVIALLAMQRLIAHGVWIGGLIFAGAACDANVHQNGVAGWLQTGCLGSAVAFCSREDRVLAGDVESAPTGIPRWRAWLWGKLLWPYGCLGRTGWRGMAAPDPRVRTIWFTGGHGIYFAAEQRERTFHQIYEIIRCAVGSGELCVADATAGSDSCRSSPMHPRRAS